MPLELLVPRKRLFIVCFPDIVDVTSFWEYFALCVCLAYQCPYVSYSPIKLIQEMQITEAKMSYHYSTKPFLLWPKLVPFAILASISNAPLPLSVKSSVKLAPNTVRYS